MLNSELIIEKVNGLMSKRLNEMKRLKVEEKIDMGHPIYDLEFEVFWELTSLKEWLLNNGEQIKLEDII